MYALRVSPSDELVSVVSSPGLWSGFTCAGIRITERPDLVWVRFL